MSLNNFTPSPGSSTRKRRIGRGIGSGMGKTATRGTKGQKARRQIHPNFEGGQSPIFKRLPVKKGFRNVNHQVFAIVNLDDLESLFKAGDTVTPEALYAVKIVSVAKDGIKVLGFGELKKKLHVEAHKFSKSAQEAIEKAGGSVKVLATLKPKTVQGVKKVKGDKAEAVVEAAVKPAKAAKAPKKTKETEA